MKLDHKNVSVASGAPAKTPAVSKFDCFYVFYVYPTASL
jgi:hypothetical protein